MPDRIEEKIARMAVRGELKTGEARAALRLIAVASSAGDGGEPARNMTVGGRVFSEACSKGVNWREQCLVGRIADRQLLDVWRVALRGRGSDPGITLAVLVFGEALSAVDRRMKRRKGWARRQVRLGIETFHAILRQAT